MTGSAGVPAVDVDAGILDLDLDLPLPAVAPPRHPAGVESTGRATGPARRGRAAQPHDHGGERGARPTGSSTVRVLLRRSGVPVGCLDLEVPAAGITAAALAALVDPDRWPARADLAAPTGDGARDLTVVVATRDRPEALDRALRSILGSTASPARVVVVDNAPADDAAARVVAGLRPDDRLRYVWEPTPGLACAHNAALPQVETRYVAFTDDDVVVDRDWTARIVEAFAAAEDVACVTGLIAPAELRTPEQWWIERGAGFAKGYRRRVVDPAVEAARDPLFPFAAGSFGSGANMAFATDVLRDLGGFDPALGAGTGSLGGDDLAAIYAVLAAGHRLVYEPAALVFHHHHRGYAALRRQVYGYGAGLTAYLTSVVVARPSTAWAMAGRAVQGARHAFAPSSARNSRRPAGSRDLVRAERVGMVTGPWRYVRTHRSRRGLRPVKG